MGFLNVGTEAIAFEDAINIVATNIQNIQRRLISLTTNGATPRSIRNTYRRKIRTQQIILRWLTDNYNKNNSENA